MLDLYNLALGHLDAAIEAHEGHGALGLREIGSLAKYCDRLTKAQAIIEQLTVLLQPDVAPELCQQLHAVYGFLWDQLQEAKKTRDTAPITVVKGILIDLRSAWRHAIHEEVE